MRKKIGETGLPCGMPALISLNSSIWPSKASLRDLLDRKVLAQVIRLIGRPSLFSVSRNWLCETWSNAPLTSRKTVDVMWPRCFSYWI